MCAGDRDGLIRWDWGKATATELLLHHVDVHFQSYSRVEHEISAQELRDLWHWLEYRLSVDEAEAWSVRKEDGGLSTSDDEEKPSWKGRSTDALIEEERQRSQQWTAQAKALEPPATSSSASAATGGGGTGEASSQVPYRIEAMNSTRSQYRIVYLLNALEIYTQYVTATSLLQFA